MFCLWSLRGNWGKLNQECWATSLWSVLSHPLSSPGTSPCPRCVDSRPHGTASFHSASHPPSPGPPTNICPLSSPGHSSGSVTWWIISILGWVLGLPHCSDPTSWGGGIRQIMGLSHWRQSALLNLGMFCPQVVFWVSWESQKAGKKNGRQGLEDECCW